MRSMPGLRLATLDDATTIDDLMKAFFGGIFRRAG